MDVAERTAAPGLGGADQLHLDQPLGAEVDLHAAGRRLGGERHPDLVALFQRRLHFGSANHLGEVRRADLLLALGHQDDVHRRSATRCPQAMQRRQEGRLRTLLIYRPPADHHPAQPRALDDPRLQRRGRPFRRVELLDVVHEVHAHGARRAIVHGGEDAGPAVGLDDVGALEPGIPQQVGHMLRAFLDVAAFRGDRGKRDPVPQAPDGFGSLPLDSGPDIGQVATAGRRREQAVRRHQRHASGARHQDQSAPMRRRTVWSVHGLSSKPCGDEPE